MKKTLRVTLRTDSGRMGLWDLSAPDANVHWDYHLSEVGREDDEVRLAILHLTEDGEPDYAHPFAMTGDTWRKLEGDGYLARLAADAVTGGKIEPAVRAQLDWYQIQYEHEECGKAWVGKGSFSCENECPKCGAAVPPVKSKFLAGLSDGRVATYYVLALQED